MKTKIIEEVAYTCRWCDNRKCIFNTNELDKENYFTCKEDGNRIHKYNWSIKPIYKIVEYGNSRI